METNIKTFFDRYAHCFNRALAGEADLDTIAAFYASAFIAASPSGVAAGENNAQLREAMAQGYDRYRAIGTKAMQIRDLRVTLIDDRHCLARVAWRSTYARDDLAEQIIDFDVHYLVQLCDDQPKIFGWIAGDEEAALKQHGIV